MRNHCNSSLYKFPDYIPDIESSLRDSLNPFHFFGSQIICASYNIQKVQSSSSHNTFPFCHRLYGVTWTLHTNMSCGPNAQKIWSMDTLPDVKCQRWRLQQTNTLWTRAWRSNQKCPIFFSMLVIWTLREHSKTCFVHTWMVLGVGRLGTLTEHVGVGKRNSRLWLREVVFLVRQMMVHW